MSVTNRANHINIEPEDEDIAATLSREVSLLDVSQCCSHIPKQREPLIRLETLSPSGVNTMIYTSYFVFIVALALAFINFPSDEVIVPLKGFCGRAADPVQCTGDAERFTARVLIPSETESVKVRLLPQGPSSSTKNGAINVNFTVSILETYELGSNGDIREVAKSRLQELKIKCTDNLCIPVTSAAFNFQLSYFVIQIESQYNFLALAPRKTDCMVYIEFEDATVFDTVPNVNFEIATKANRYLVFPSLRIALSVTTLAIIWVWLSSYRASKRHRHLPQCRWISMSLAALLLYDNPVYGIWDLIAYKQGKPLSHVVHFWFQTGEMLGFMCIMLWMFMMSTGIAAMKTLPLSFYLPKISFVLTYAYMFFAIGVIFAFQRQNIGIWLRGVWIIAILGFQTKFYVYIIIRAFTTWKFLRKLPYYRTRFQQLSFRVFIMQAVLLLVSMLLLFLLFLIQYASTQSLTNASTGSFGFTGRKIFIHTIVYAMAYCYLEPLSIHNDEDESEAQFYREGQYVIYERDLHHRPASHGRNSILSQVRDQMFQLYRMTSRIAEPITSTLYYSNRQDKAQDESDLRNTTLAENQPRMVFCLETAARMLNLSATAYYDPHWHENTTLSSFGVQGRHIHSIEEQGYRSMHFIAHEDTVTIAMVVIGYDRLVVVFRGTGSFTNVKTDFQYNQMPYPYTDGRSETYDQLKTKPCVHKGFWTAYESIRRELVEFINEQLNQRALPVYCSGHSLGAALATLAAIDIYDTLQIAFAYDTQVFLYNYGSPRVGNHAFAEYFDARIPNAFRVTCDGDIVTGIPKHDYCGKSFFAPYKHIGIEVVLDPNGRGNLIIDPSFVEKKFSLRCRGSATNHLLRSYRLGFRVLEMPNDSNPQASEDED